MIHGRLYQPLKDENNLPYVVLDYPDGGKNSPLKEVVLGPKNENLNIEIFLTAIGLKNVAIRRLEASYR
jgi:hypothetical protein